MNKIILMLILAVASGNAAAMWILVGHNQNENYTGYADRDTISKEGNRVKMWSLIDYKTVATAGEKQFMSMKVQSEYDCMLKQKRILYSSGHPGSMGRGEPVYSSSDPGKWVAVPPESVNQALWKFACGKD